MPKVSCICITHDRTKMLERVVQCFEAQTYPNKELVILFQDDPVTESYVKSHTQYRYCELREEREPHITFSLQVLPEDTSHLRDGMMVMLRDANGFALEIDNNGDSQFCYLENPSCDVLIVMLENGRFLLQRGTYWINLRSDGSCSTTTVRDEACSYDYSVNLDSTIIIECGVPDHLRHGIERVGWEKRVIQQGTSDRIVFYKISPKGKISLGGKRNLCIRAATGEYILVWDDDDWYAENRMDNQMKFLQFTNKEACSLAYTILFDQNTQQAYYNENRVTGHENSLLFRKDSAGTYDNLNVKEDTPMLLGFYNRNQLSVMESPELYIYNYHRKNTSSSNHFRKVISGSTPLDKNYSSKVKKILQS